MVKKKKGENTAESDDDDLDDIEIEVKFDRDGEIIKTKEMKRYEKETGKYSVWRGVVTEGFKKWLKGETVYSRDKERISLYVTENTKQEWQEFIKNNNFSTISKLIRQAVDYYIEHKSNLISGNVYESNSQAISNISHALKEPLTTIKGFSQLILENYNKDLNEEVLETIENIFDQSILLENKIVNILDNISREKEVYDVLLIEDDLATIRLLTSYFESKGYSCKGVISGTKGIDQLKNTMPKLILLDIILPDLNGYDLCKMIKSDKNYKNIPVYLLTAIPGSEVEKKIEETKADGYILKPFDFSDFEIVFQYLN